MRQHWGESPAHRAARQKSTNNPQRALSRRTALTGLGAGGLGLALTAPGRHAAAQEEAVDLTGHPLVGTWAVMTPGGIVPQIHGADGSFIAAFPPNYVDPMLGLTFQGSALSPGRTGTPPGLRNSWSR